MIYGPPRPDRIAKNVKKFTLGLIYEKLVVIFTPCYGFVCPVRRSYCPGFDVIKGPQNPKNMIFVLHILSLNLIISYQIAFLFDMYIFYMCGRIEQDMPNLIIEDPLVGPQIAQNIQWFFYIIHL